MKRIICIAAAFLITLMLSGKVTAAGALCSSAKAAVLIDARTGEIVYSKNHNAKLPVASTTKIMTTLLTLESGGLDTGFVIDSRALLTEGSSMYLREGETVTKRDLCYGMMLPSGNDAANAAALKISGDYESFARRMNRRAREIGMKNTNFVTPSGLHDKDHYSTAYDMALLAAEAMKNSAFREICSSESVTLSSEDREYDRYLYNTNRLLRMYEYCIGIKTGFTDEAGRCLVSAAEKDGVTLIAVTLNDRNDWKDHIDMYTFGFGCVRLEELRGAGKDISVKTAGGTDGTVKCALAETPVCTSVNGRMPEITGKYNMPPFVYAPVRAGDKIGRAEFYAGDRLVFSTDIIAAEDCPYKEADIKIPLYRVIIDRLKPLFEKQG